MLDLEMQIFALLIQETKLTRFIQQSGTTNCLFHFLLLLMFIASLLVSHKDWGNRAALSSPSITIGLIFIKQIFFSHNIILIREMFSSNKSFPLYLSAHFFPFICWNHTNYNGNIINLLKFIKGIRPNNISQ